MPFDKEEYGLPADQFKLAIEEYLGHLSESAALTDEEYRYQEYQAIIRLEGKPSCDFYAKEFSLEEYDPFIAAFFNRIICIN